MIVLADAGNAGGSALVSLLPLLLIGLFVYFAMIRPQRKRQQQFQKMQQELSTGDDVITAGGIHGRVDALGDGYVDLEVTEDVVLRFKRSSVAEILTEDTGEESADVGADEVEDE